MAIISRLGVVLGLDSGEFNAGLGQAKTGLNNFSVGSGLAKAGVAALGTALVATAKEALQFANEMTELAKANEMSVASVLEMSAALSTSGGKLDNTGKILASFTNKVDEAAQGSQNTRDKFKELGISLADLGKLSEEDLLRQTIKGLSQIEDPIRRNALAFDLLGKGIRGVDLKDFNKDLQTVKGSYDKSEESFRRIEDWGNRIAKSWFDAKVAIADYIVQLADSMEKNKKIMAGQNAYSKAFYGDQESGKPANPLTPAAKPVAGRAIVASDEDKKRVTAAEKIRDVMRQQSLEYQRQINSIGKVQTFESKLAIEFEKGGKYVGQQNTELGKRLIKEAKALDIAKLKYDGEEAIKKVLEEHSKLRDKADEDGKNALALVIERRQAEREAFDLATQDVQIAAERLDYEKQLAGLSDTQKQKALEFFDLSRKMKRMAETEVGLDSEQMGKRQKAEQDRIVAQEENARAQKTFQAGWDNAYNNFVEKAQDSAAIGAQAFNNMASSMTSALDRFVETGKFSFSGLIASMIQDLMKMQLRAAASGLFSQLLSGVGSLFGGGATAGTSNVSPGIKFFANGGDPPVGVPSIVGERGAELFIPKTAGTIVPNNALSSMMGNQPQVVYNGPYIANMSTIDSKSFEQRIYQSSSAVWAANAYANKSMPTTGGRT
jgi:lambda family phage tail tape measure protein